RLVGLVGGVGRGHGSGSVAVGSGDVQAVGLLGQVEREAGQAGGVPVGGGHEGGLLPLRADVGVGGIDVEVVGLGRQGVGGDRCPRDFVGDVARGGGRCGRGRERGLHRLT